MILTGALREASSKRMTSEPKSGGGEEGTM